MLISDAAVVDDDEDEYVPKISKENLETLNEAYASVFHIDNTTGDMPSLTDDGNFFFIIPLNDECASDSLYQRALVGAADKNLDDDRRSG